MQIEVSDRIFSFKQSIDHHSKGFNGEWYALDITSGKELSFTFNQKVFADRETGILNIDWDAIKHLIKHVLAELDGIQQKGSRVLEALYHEVFSSPNDLTKLEGFFQLEDIELQKIRISKYGDKCFYYFEYHANFFLDSRKDYLMDPNHQYYATFSNHNGLSIIGVTRIG